MTPLMVLAYAALALVMGGFVKGTLGVGLPLVVLPLLSFVVPGHQAIAIMIVPVLASNAWQAWETRVDGSHLRRFLPLMIALVLSTLLTARMTIALSDEAITVLIAIAVLLAVCLMLWQPAFNVTPTNERRWGVVVGWASGLLGGVSSLAGPLIISFLLALRLPRETFVGCISIIYLAAALPLYITMVLHGKVSADDVGWSAAALAPMWIGLTLGRVFRHRLSEVGFRRVLLAFLISICVVLILR
jgi:uncharacterized protein